MSRVESARQPDSNCQTTREGMAMLHNKPGRESGKRTIRVAGVALMVALAAPFCSGQATPASTAQTAAFDQAGDRAPSDEIVLRPGDTIKINVYETPELAQTARVAADGTVSLQLSGGIVKVGGLSEAEASHVIDQKYIDAGILKQQTTTVLIQDFASRGVSILGEVVRPGVYPVAGPRSLVDVLALAGGLTMSADTHVTIQHGDGSLTVATVSMPREDGGKILANDVRVLPGDKVVAPRAGIVYILGEVTRPGGYIMQHDGRITVLQAVAAAEGTTRFSSEKNAYLIRRTGDTYQTEHISIRDMYKGKQLDLPLNPGDVVYVPLSNLRNFVFNAPGILGSLAGAAIYSIHN